MPIRVSDLIQVERISCNAGVSSKKRALEELSKLLATAPSQASAEHIFDTLVSRERLGSTGLGHGVALPHGRFGTGTAAIGAFLTLKKAIDFDAIDREPVDLLFALLVPEDATDDHLQILATLAGMFRDPDLCNSLRELGSPESACEILTSWDSA